MPRRILIIEDDPGIREFLQGFFEDREFNVDAAADGLEGVEKFQKGTYELVLCDMLMPKMIGINVLKRIREVKPEQKVIMMSGVKEDSMVQTAKGLGCHQYLNKPVKLSDLESCVQECFPEEE